MVPDIWRVNPLLRLTPNKQGPSVLMTQSRAWCHIMKLSSILTEPIWSIVCLNNHLYCSTSAGLDSVSLDITLVASYFFSVRLLISSLCVKNTLIDKQEFVVEYVEEKEARFVTHNVPKQLYVTCVLRIKKKGEKYWENKLFSGRHHSCLDFLFVSTCNTLC